MPKGLFSPLSEPLVSKSSPFLSIMRPCGLFLGVGFLIVHVING